MFSTRVQNQQMSLPPRARNSPWNNLLQRMVGFSNIPPEMSGAFPGEHSTPIWVELAKVVKYYNKLKLMRSIAQPESRKIFLTVFFVAWHVPSDLRRDSFDGHRKWPSADGNGVDQEGWPGWKWPLLCQLEVRRAKWQTYAGQFCLPSRCNLKCGFTEEVVEAYICSERCKLERLKLCPVVWAWKLLPVPWRNSQEIKHKEKPNIIM